MGWIAVTIPRAKEQWKWETAKYMVLPMVRMTNTYIANGKTDPADIIADTKQGVYVAHLGGGQVNTATGDFVFGMTEAYLIEDGKVTAPIREGNLIGNGPEVLNQIDALGNDFAMGSPGTWAKTVKEYRSEMGHQPYESKV